MSPAPLTWRISSTARATAVLALVTVVLAVVSGRGELVTITAPLLLWLTVALRAPRPATTALAATSDRARCAEGEEIELTLDAPTGDGLVYRGELLTGHGPGDPQLVRAGATSWRVRLPNWGAQTLRVTVQIATPGGAWSARVGSWPSAPVVEVKATAKRPGSRIAKST